MRLGRKTTSVNAFRLLCRSIGLMSDLTPSLSRNVFPKSPVIKSHLVEACMWHVVAHS
jgi:hypothetical protein